MSEITVMQSAALKQAGIPIGRASWHGADLVAPVGDHSFIVINPHGSTSTYPNELRDHVLQPQ